MSLDITGDGVGFWRALMKHVEFLMNSMVSCHFRSFSKSKNSANKKTAPASKVWKDAMDGMEYTDLSFTKHLLTASTFLCPCMFSPERFPFAKQSFVSLRLRFLLKVNNGVPGIQGRFQPDVFPTNKNEKSTFFDWRFRSCSRFMSWKIPIVKSSKKNQSPFQSFTMYCISVNWKYIVSCLNQMSAEQFLSKGKKKGFCVTKHF